MFFFFLDPGSWDFCRHQIWSPLDFVGKIFEKYSKKNLSSPPRKVENTLSPPKSVVTIYLLSPAKSGMTVATKYGGDKAGPWTLNWCRHWNKKKTIDENQVDIEFKISFMEIKYISRLNHWTLRHVNGQVRIIQSNFSIQIQFSIPVLVLYKSKPNSTFNGLTAQFKYMSSFIIKYLFKSNPRPSSSSSLW